WPAATAPMYNDSMACRDLNISRVLCSIVAGAFITVVLGWTAMFYPGGPHGYGPPADQELGMVLTSRGDRNWQISSGRNGWHHVVTYWHMQVSGHSIIFSLSDIQAREFTLTDFRAH